MADFCETFDRIAINALSVDFSSGEIKCFDGIFEFFVVDGGYFEMVLFELLVVLFFFFQDLLIEKVGLLLDDVFDLFDYLW